MLKLLRILMLLSSGRRYTLLQLMERFEQSDRTIYRHLEAIAAAGFVLERTESAYHLQTNNDAVKSLQKVAHFSEEEAYIVYKTIGLLQGTSAIQEQLAAKLNSLYDFRSLSLQPDKNNQEIYNKLGVAISNKKQVILQAYRSGNSYLIADRTVEPFSFLTDYSGVWCYDPESKTSKHFKIARIENVALLATDAINHLKHCIPFTDAFRMSAAESIAEVKATLTLKAYNLLLEEFPMAEAFVQAVNGHYLLQVPIADYNGIGRFVLGLPGDVKVASPVAFIDFLKLKINIFLDDSI